MGRNLYNNLYNNLANAKLWRLHPCLVQIRRKLSVLGNKLQ